MPCFALIEIIILAGFGLIGGLFVLILLILIRSLTFKTFIDTEKLSPFECGFSPKLNSRINFSLQFFLITLIFLVFDVELILMFPFLGHFSNGYNLTGFIRLILFIIILSWGLF